MAKQTLDHPSPTAHPKGLAHAASSSMFWLIVVSLGSKLLSFGGQIALAWILVPKDFGLIGLAYTAMSFAAIIEGVGLREVLIHRQRKFHRWSNAAFWLSTVSGTIAMLTMAALAPIAAHVYCRGDMAADAPTVMRLILILSLVCPFNAMYIVPLAQLQNQLRFKAVSLIGLGTSIVLLGTNIILALMGFGAYSFAVAWPVSACFRFIVSWSLSQPRVIRYPQIKRWKFLLSDAAMTLGSGVCWFIISQSDYMMLGVFHDKATVGLYWFAFNLSTQSASIITFQLASVLLPTLSKVQSNPQHQVRAFMRAMWLIVWVGFPLCILQAVVAHPVLLLLYDTKWIAAVPILQILSLGMAMVLVQLNVRPLLMAQGRFRTWFVFSACSAILFFTSVTAGAVLGGAFSVAIAATCAFSVAAPSAVIIGTWKRGVHAAEILKLFVYPVVAATLFATPVIFFLPYTRDFHRITLIPVIAIATLVILGGSVLVMKMMMPQIFQDLIKPFSRFRRAPLLSTPDQQPA